MNRRGFLGSILAAAAAPAIVRAESIMRVRPPTGYVLDLSGLFVGYEAPKTILVPHQTAAMVREVVDGAAMAWQSWAHFDHKSKSVVFTDWDGSVSIVPLDGHPWSTAL